jgi:hypothetical protein
VRLPIDVRPLRKDGENPNGTRRNAKEELDGF